MIKKLLSLSAFLATVAMAKPVYHESSSQGDFGLGLIVGQPTGISGKYNLDSESAIDGAAGWAFGGAHGFTVHSDYLRKVPRIFSADSASFDLHWGGGLRFLGASNSKFGVRVPVGVDYNFKNQPIELFLEAALIVDIAPKTDADFDAGIGGRWYF